MFEKILIANRGEIAVRIIRACKEMGIQTVAIYSEADREALHVELADEAVCVGPGRVTDSYLHQENIIEAAKGTGAEAIHPGFGFLSENSSFARRCQEEKLVFIGPNPEMIDAMGNKSEARALMIANKVPVVPGSEGPLKDKAEALQLAQAIGYPVILKASSGGGGRGMRVVRDRAGLENAYDMAAGEAKIAFGDGTLYLEKYIENPKHIEIQILGDHYGQVIHLGERDCSMQRRHQKVLEEAPSAVLSEALRQEMGSIAVQAAKAVAYNSIGTVEFLLDQQGHFYFIEMNTRIQVEHPVTEMVTGRDLVRWQIEIAAGEPLGCSQAQVNLRGHAIECRINAENPDLQFRPCPGLIEALHLPGGYGVRIDSAIYQGYEVPALYDSMLAKLIVHGKDRAEAMARMKRALDEFIVQGIDTNISFQRALIESQDFQAGTFHTGTIESYRPNEG